MRKRRKNELSSRALSLAIAELLIVVLLLDPKKHVSVLAVIAAVIVGLAGAIDALTWITERRRGE